MTTPRGGARARAGPPVALRPDARRSRCRRADWRGRRSPPDDGSARGAGASRHGRPRTRTGRPRSTSTPSIGSPRRAGAATRSPTGRDPATRAATTSSTGSAGRTRRSGRAPTRSTARARRWNAARLDGYLAALDPPGGEPPQPSSRRGGACSTRRQPRPSAPILGLRTDRGLPLEDAAAAAARRRPSTGRSGCELLEVTADERIVLTTRGRLLSNELFARLV